MSEAEKNDPPRDQYDSDSIKVLKGPRRGPQAPGHVHRRHSDGTGLHHMVFEVVDNSIDEALAGFCNEITVTIHTDNSISVTITGAAFPRRSTRTTSRNAPPAEIVMTELHAAGVDNNSYKIAGGLHGVGVSVVNALSEWLRSAFAATEKATSLEFRRGVPVAPLKVTGKTERRGTEVHFLASAEIFGVVEYHFDILARRLRELSFLNNGVKNPADRSRSGKEENFAHTGGKGFVEYINRSKNVLHGTPFYAIAQKDGITVEVAMRGTTPTRSRCSASPQHSAARRRNALDRPAAAMTRSLNQYIEANEVAKKAKVETPRRYREGLSCVLSVKCQSRNSLRKRRTSSFPSEVGPWCRNSWAKS